MGKKTQTPKAPDYTATANQQAFLSRTAADDMTATNRPNQENQFGSLTWDKDPVTGMWTQKNELNQPQQDIFNQQQANQQGIANAAGGMLGGFDTSQVDLSGAPAMGTVSDYSKLGNIPGQVDYSSLGQIPQVGQYDQRATDLYRQLGQPDLDRSQNARMANLAARGISDLNSGAGNNLMQQLGDQTNRFGMEAAQRGIAQGNTMFGQGMQGYQQGAQNLNNQWQQAMAGRQQGAKEMDTQFGQQNQLHQQGVSDILNQKQGNLEQLKGMFGLGQQMGVPQYNSFNQGTAYQTPDLMGAASKGYDAQLNTTNAKNADSSNNMKTVGTVASIAATVF